MAYITKNIKRTTLFNKLGGFRRVENMPSHRGGDRVANEIILGFKNGEVFQSHNQIIAVRWYADGAIWVVNDFDCSNSTRNYTTDFLKKDYKTIKKLMERGVYKLLNIDYYT